MRVPSGAGRGRRDGGGRLPGADARVARVLIMGLCAGYGAMAAMAADRPPVVAERLALESIGVNGVSATLLSAGASMLTVHFLDDTHLLVTFGTHGLVRRLENDPKDDEDRMVAMEIVELPSGKVVAKDEWQAHDHARYLWNLGGGRFVMRTAQEYFEIEPLAHLASGKPFERIQIKAFQRPSLLLVSPDQNILTVESRVRVKQKEQQWGDVAMGNVPVTMLVEFYRMHGGGDGSRLSLELAGRVLAPQPLFLPISGDGALYAEPKGRSQRWQVKFTPFGGAEMKAGEIDSSCDPQLQLVSRSEYIAVVCRGPADTVVLKAYAFDGHEAWEEPLSGMDDPVYATAPETGRFAVVRKLDSAGPGEISNGDSAPVARQELRVYQTESGDLLLKVELSPAFKSAENFDLSRDGSLAVAVKDRALVVYKLPELDKQDRKDMELAAKSAPPVVSSGAIRLPAVVETASVEAAAGAVAAEKVRAEVASGAASGSASGAPTAKGRAVEAQQAAAEAPRPAVRRTPPTLLKPGEKPEFGKANPQPAESADSPDVPH